MVSIIIIIIINIIIIIIIISRKRPGTHYIGCRLDQEKFREKFQEN